MSTTRVIARNIFSNWANLAVSLLIGFFMMPFLVSRLGDTLYGIWTLVVSLIGYGSLLDFGVRSSIVKYVSQHHATDERDRLRRLFITALAVYAVIGALILVLTAVAALLLLDLFRIPADLVGEARLVLFIVGVDLALKFPAGVFEGFLIGLQRYDIANGIAIGSNLLRAILIVALLVKGEKLLALAAITLASDLLMSTVMAVVCLRLLPWLRLHWQHLDRMVFREVYKYGVWSYAITIASRVLYDSDSILIGMFLPAAAITHFAVGNSIVRYLRQLAYGYGNVFNPAASELEARNRYERLPYLIISGTRYALAVILPAAIIFALNGREFLTLWMGPGYAAESGTVLIILVLSQVAVMAQFSAGAVLYGLNRHRYLAFILLGEAFFKVALCLALLPSYGIIGAAVGTAIPELSASLLLIPVLTTRCVGMRLSRYFQEAFLPPALGGLVLAATIAMLNPVVGSGAWVLLIGKTIAGLAVYTIICFFTCFNRQQRQALSGLFGRVLKTEENC